MLKEEAEKYVSENEDKIIEFVKYKLIFTDFYDRTDDVKIKLEETLLKGAKKGNVLMSALYAVVCAYNSFDGLFKEEEGAAALFDNNAIDRYNEIIVDMFDTIVDEDEMQDLLGWPLLKIMKCYAE